MTPPRRVARRKPTRARGKKTAAPLSLPINVDTAGELSVEIREDLAARLLDEDLQRAEDTARTVLAEHAGAVAAAEATFDPDRQRLHRLFKSVFGESSMLIEHDEPVRPRSRLKPRPCKRCQAAHRLLWHAGEIRFHLQNGAAEVAARYALHVGRLWLRLGLRDVEDDADRGRAFAAGPRGPRRDLLARELEALLARKPDLTAADVIAVWRCDPPDCVQEVEPNGSVSWFDGPGPDDQHTTSVEGLNKRLQRLRKARKDS